MNTPNRKSRQTRTNESTATAQPPRWQWIIAICIVAIAAALPYLQTLQHQFINYDDNQYITENEIVQRGLTGEGVAWAFTTMTASNWHPLTWISHMIDATVWGNWAGGHHLTNLLLHAINSALVLIALALMSGSLWRSAFVALIFAVHPLHVESVAWVAERKDVLSTFFGLLAIIAYVGYVQQPNLGRYAIVACAFAFSLMSKPMLVTLPFVLLLLDYWPLKRLGLPEVTRVKWVLIEKIPLLGLSIASSVITIIAQKSGGAMYTLEWVPLGNRIANAIAAYGMYLAKTVWPANLALIYPLQREIPTGLVIASALVLIVISSIAVMFIRKRPAIIVGWLWFLGTLVPVIGLVQVGMQSMADRYMYVPMIGLLIMVAWSVPDPARLPRPMSIALSAAAGVVAIALLICAWVKASRWKDTITLFAHTVSVTVDNSIAHNILGYALRAAGRFDESREHLSIALRLNPNYAAVHNNFGRLMLDLGQFAEAEKFYRQSLRLNDREPTVWNNLGSAVLEQNRAAEAESLYRHALELKPDFPEALVNLGRSLAAQNRLQEAVAAYRQAIGMRPTFAEAHANLGVVLWNLGQVAEAIAAYNAALQHNPSSIDTRVNLGVALASQDRFDEAIAQFEAALQLDPNRADARQFLELAKQQRGQ